MNWKQFIWEIIGSNYDKLIYNILVIHTVILNSISNVELVSIWVPLILARHYCYFWGCFIFVIHLCMLELLQKLLKVCFSRFLLFFGDLCDIQRTIIVKEMDDICRKFWYILSMSSHSKLWWFSYYKKHKVFWKNI